MIELLYSGFVVIIVIHFMYKIKQERKRTEATRTSSIKMFKGPKQLIVGSYPGKDGIGHDIKIIQPKNHKICKEFKDI